MLISEFKNENFTFRQLWDRRRERFSFNLPLDEKGRFSDKEIPEDILDDLREDLLPMTFLNQEDLDEVFGTLDKDWGDMTKKWTYEVEDWRQILVFCPDCLRRLLCGIDAFEAWVQFETLVMDNNDKEV